MLRQGSVIHALLNFEALWALALRRRDRFIDVGGHALTVVGNGYSSSETAIWSINSALAV